MDSYQTDIEKLLDDYTFRNWVLRSNQEDFEKWETLLDRDQELKRIADEAKSIILLAELAEDGLSENENKDALAQLMQKIKVNEVQLNETNDKKNVSITSIKWIRYAAAVVLLLVAGGSFYFAVSLFSTRYQAAKDFKIEHAAKPGQILTLQLADGSKIKLNSNSTINLSEDFASERIVKLKGEAFFEVAKNKKLPFRVITGNVVVEVVGTSFNINSYKDQHAKISVESGIVRVNATNGVTHQLTLIKQQAALFDAEKNELLQANFDPDEFLWRDGILVFRNDDIMAMARKLEYWYGVTIEISNPEKITGQFNGTYEKEALDNILTGAGYVLNFSFSIDQAHKKVTINPN